MSTFSTPSPSAPQSEVDDIDPSMTFDASDREDPDGADTVVAVETAETPTDPSAVPEGSAVVDDLEPDAVALEALDPAEHGSVEVKDGPAPDDEAASADRDGEETPTDVAEGDSAAGESEVIDGEALLEAQPHAAIISPYDKPGKWYVVHTQSGYEKKVKQNIEARTSSMNMEDRIHEVVIPMEDVMEFRNGKKVVVQKKVFPGYLLVRCRLNDDAWYVVRNTPGVTGFVGAGHKPSPLPRKDVEAFLSTKPEGEEVQKPTKPRLAYEMGETVRVKEGPFADFSGEIVEINEDQLRVKVLVNIFGRETPVELEFAQVAKL